MGLEIERKFVLSVPPALLPLLSEEQRAALIGSIPLDIEIKMTSAPMSKIRQLYIDMGSDSTPEKRLRRREDESGVRYYYTEKGKGDLCREENETEIDEERFNALSKSALPFAVEKERYLIPMNGHTLELDIYRGKLEGLTVLEIEFESEESAAAFDGRALGAEVTYNKEFRNKNLAKI